MAYYATNEITGNTTAVALTGVQVFRHPTVSARAAADVQSVTGTIILASGTNLAINDVIELVVLPADHIPLDFLLTTDQFDSNATPTLAANIGLMTGSIGDASRIQTAVGSTFGAAVKFGSVAGSTARAGQSNGTASALTLVQYAQTIAQTTSNTADRSIGLAVTTAAATNPATARRLDFTLFFRWSRYGA
jgi:hypothetical protein